MVFPGRLGTANFRANFVTDRVVPACPSQICEGSQNTHRNVTERNMMGDFAWLLSLPVAGITATLARAILADLKLNFGCGQALPKGREQFYAQCPFFDNDLSRSSAKLRRANSTMRSRVRDTGKALSRVAELGFSTEGPKGISCRSNRLAKRDQRGRHAYHRHAHARLRS